MAALGYSPSVYPPAQQVSKTTNLRPGDVLVTGRAHIVMYLYTASNGVSYFIDQSHSLITGNWSDSMGGYDLSICSRTYQYYYSYV